MFGPRIEASVSRFGEIVLKDMHSKVAAFAHITGSGRLVHTSSKRKRCTRTTAE